MSQALRGGELVPASYLHGVWGGLWRMRKWYVLY